MQLVSAVEDASIEQIFCAPDDVKLHSSMTLFAEAAEQSAVFNAALRKYCNGRPERQTLERS